MVRLKDIARSAGADVSTVSRALSGDPEINAHTRERIKKIASDMGYEKKLRQMRSGKIPGLVGILVPEVFSGYYSAMLDRLQATLAAREKTALLGVTDFDSAKAHLFIRGFAKAGAEGLIYIMDACEAPLKVATEKVLRSCGVPAVFINGSNRHHTAFDSVYVDELSGTRKAVSHLIGLGHKSIGYIGETRTPGRGEACRAVLEENGLPCNPTYFRVGSERLEQGGYLRMKELLSGAERPTAVFIAYDQMAIGAIRALKESGLSVPGGLSVVGFDNIGASEYVLGGLTTVATPMEDTAALAVRLLVDRIGAGPNKAVQHVTIQPTLMIRRSTASIPVL